MFLGEFKKFKRGGWGERIFGATIARRARRRGFERRVERLRGLDGAIREDVEFASLFVEARLRVFIVTFERFFTS